MNLESVTIDHIDAHAGIVTPSIRMVVSDLYLGRTHLEILNPSPDLVIYLRDAHASQVRVDLSDENIEAFEWHLRLQGTRHPRRAPRAHGKRVSHFRTA